MNDDQAHDVVRSLASAADRLFANPNLPINEAKERLTAMREALVAEVTAVVTAAPTFATVSSSFALVLVCSSMRLRSVIS